jgi:hypothetical protein
MRTRTLYKIRVRYERTFQKIRYAYLMVNRPPTMESPSYLFIGNTFTYHFSQLLHKLDGSKLVYVPFTYLIITYVKIRTYLI